MAQKSNSNWLQNHKIVRTAYQRFYYGLCKRHIYVLTSPLRVLPDFIVIGVVRGGTTSLYHYLGQHPCIARAAYDELGFFDTNFELGINWYKSLFPIIFTKNRIIRKWKHFMTFDVTPFYIYNPNVADRIHSTLPNVRLITVLRNPVDRAYSNYHLGIRSGNERRTFEEVVEMDLKKIQDHRETTKNEDYFEQIIDKSFLGRGFYAEQLQIWMNLFPKEQLLVISSEDLADKTDQTLATIFEFLKLPNYKINDLTKRNEAEYPQMSQEIRRTLVDYFKPHNEKLYSMLGRRFDWDK